MPKARRITQEAVLELLQEQVGRGSALKAAEIVETLTNQRSNETQERELREIIRKLRLAGQPICTHSAHGYWWASSPNDLEAACGFLRGKAMSSLRQISKLHRLAMPALAGQMDMFYPPDQEPAPGSVAMMMDLPAELIEAIQDHLNRTGQDWNQLCTEAIRGFLQLSAAEPLDSGTQTAPASQSPRPE
jgi:hypothetical protein